MAKSPRIEEVILRKKASWQKDDCLYCNNKATMEAYITTRGEAAVQIRCCTSQACIDKAKEEALGYVKF